MTEDALQASRSLSNLQWPTYVCCVSVCTISVCLCVSVYTTSVFCLSSGGLVYTTSVFFLPGDLEYTTNVVVFFLSFSLLNVLLRCDMYNNYTAKKSARVLQDASLEAATFIYTAGTVVGGILAILPGGVGAADRRCRRGGCVLALR